MPLTISKEDILSTIDLLEHKRLVHVFCRMEFSLPAISEIVTAFALSREHMGLQGRYDWRTFVMSNPFQRALDVVSGVKKRVPAQGFVRWDTAIKGRHGDVRAVVASPISLQGVTGNNLFFVLLGNHNEDVWNAMWPAVAKDTRILAVNSELFSERSEFAYVDWGE